MNICREFDWIDPSTSLNRTSSLLTCQSCRFVFHREALVFPNHNKDKCVRLLGWEVIKLHCILLLREFIRNIFFLLGGRRRPASISFHSTVSCMVAWDLTREGVHAAFTHPIFSDISFFLLSYFLLFCCYPPKYNVPISEPNMCIMYLKTERMYWK